ncbi:kinase [Sporosarcina luteola]|uniref:kinase n=1 Tax=Sporosarcina luteola TaxID=582850 RepID=UPI00203F6411|nr:kinase [Sporosarcina luteola]MCM3742949.1 kinase [Sporosarcina luteola]
MSINEMVDMIIFQFSIRPNQACPLIVGIDGLGGSGKTTLVKEIAQGLSCHSFQALSIHLDDHIVERKNRYQTGYEEWYEYYYLQWNVDKLTSNLFEPLNSGYNNLSLDFYDKSTDTALNKHISLTSESVVLIEGIFLQRQEWRRFYNLLIYIDCPRERRYERVLNRDLYIGNYEERLNKYQRRYWVAEEHYMDIIKPIMNADVVYNTKN